jgi:hypothetical protein
MCVGLFSAIACAQNMPRITGARPGAPFQRPLRFVPARNGSFIGLSGVPLNREGHRRGGGRNAFFYGGWPYFPPEYEDASEPVVYVQPPAAPASPAPQPRQEAVPSAALLELQGNQWVKVTSFTSTQVPAGSGSSTSPVVPKELPPAVLVYRDGHSEEVSSYSIIGATLYTKSDFWTSGAWSRKIQIADLDLPATVKQNRDRGIKFDLPSSPDEVILRP